MNEPDPATDPTDLARIAAALDLPEDAGIEDIRAALVDLTAANRAPDPARYVPIGAVADLMAAHRDQSASMSDREAEARVDAATVAGHITPAMRDWAVALCRQSPDSFDEFVSSSAAPFAKMFERQHRPRLRAPGSAHVDADTAALCRQLDLDPSAFG